MQNKLTFGIVIPVHNAARYLEGFISSLNKQTYGGYKLLIVDDGSSDGTSEIAARLYPDVILLKGDGDFWWTKCVNLGIKRFDADKDITHILLMNIDVEMDVRYLENMKDASEKFNNAVFGSAIYDIETRKPVDLGWAEIKYFTAKGINNIKNPENLKKDFIPANHLSGRGMLIPKQVIESVGMFDEKKFPQYAADDVFTIRARKKGFPLYCNSKAQLYSYVKQTGVYHYFKKPVVKNFIRYLTEIKSQGNIKVRTRYALEIAPKALLINYILADEMKNVLSFFIRYIKTKK